MEHLEQKCMGALGNRHIHWLLAGGILDREVVFSSAKSQSALYVGAINLVIDLNDSHYL